MRLSSVFAVATATVVVALTLACGSGSEATTPAPVGADLGGAPPTAVGDAKGQLLNYNGRFKSDPLLTAAEVALIPPAEMKLVRNEVYARYGRPFNNPELKAHFEGQAWYVADAGYSDARLSANDKANLELITSFEAEAKNLVQIGEFTSDPAQIMFVDAKTVTVDPTFGMYESARTTLHWASRGNWVILWEGPPSWDPRSPGIRNAELWRVDVDKRELQKVASLETPAR